MTYDGSYLREAYRLVPEIGEGRRWYDFPYKVLNRILCSRVGRKLPRGARVGLTYVLNFLHPFNEYHRFLAWDPRDRSHNVTAPVGETLEVPGIWVVEIFPPSEFDSLVRSLDRNSWDAKRVRYGLGERNRSYLDRMRSGGHGGWWKLGQVVSGGGRFIYPDAKVGRLPKGFDAVELTATHIGDGLTAVVAFFRASESGAAALNDEWHREHEPQLVWRRWRPKAEDRM